MLLLLYAVTLALSTLSIARGFSWRKNVISSTRLNLTGRFDNFSDPTTDFAIKLISYPIGAYLLLYRPVERTKAVLDKVSELLRVGDSQNLLSI